MLSLFLTPFLAGAVSFAADAVSVKDLLASLSSQTGTQLICSKELEAEPLIVDFKDRPVDEVLPRLAAALDAEWHDEKGAQKLERSVELKAKLLQEEKLKVLNRLDEILTKQSAKAEAAPKLTPAEAQIFMDRYRLPALNEEGLSFEIKRMSSTNPITLAAMRMLAKVGAKNLVALTTKMPAVYSDQPTTMQKPLPKEALAALEDLKGDLKLMEAAVARIGKRKGPLINIGGMPEVGPGKFKDGYGKTLLKVVRTSSLTYTFDLTMVGKDGQRLLAGSGYLPSINDWMMVRLNNKGQELNIPETATKFAQLSRSVGYAYAGTHFAQLPDGRKITGSYAVTHFEKETSDPLGDFRKLLYDPVTNDPIGLAIGSVVRQSAAGDSLIASLGDGAIIVLGRRIASGEMKTRLDVREMLELSGVEPDIRIPFATYDTTTPGWTVVKSYLPVANRLGRINRTALRDLITRLRATSTISLDDASNYYRRAGRLPNFGAVDWMYMTNVDPACDQSIVSYVFSQSLPLLASLKPGQWSQAETGLSYVSLVADQKKIVDQWVYGGVNYEPFIVERGTFLPFARSYPLEVEPTEMFPKGVPSATKLVIETTESPVAIARSTKGMAYVMDANSLGLFESLRETPDQYPEAAARVLESYAQGRRVGYRLHLQLTDKIVPVFTAQEVRTDSAPGARSSLAPAFVKEANVAYDAFVRGRIRRKSG